MEYSKAADKSAQNVKGSIITGSQRKHQQRNETLLSALAIVGMLLFVYRDVVFGGKTFLIEGGSDGTMPGPNAGPYGYEGPRDPRLWDSEAPATIGEPSDRFIMQSYHDGDLPLWNPHQGLGIPLAANGQSGMFDPLKLIIYLAPPSAFPVAEDLHLLFRYFLAGLFTYLFARSLGTNFASGLGASAIYMFGTYFMRSANIAFIRLDTLLPLVVYAYHQLATRRSWQAFALTAVAVFLLVVADFPEVIAIHISVGLLLYSFSGLLMLRRTKQFRRDISVLILQAISATGIGVLMGTFVLIPFIQYFLSASHVHHPELMNQLLMGAWPIPMVSQFLIPAGRIDLGWMYFFVMIPIIFALLLSATNYRLVLQRARPLLVYGAFFVIVIVALICIIFRIPPLNWVADLPFANLIYMNRYLQPSILLITALLGAVALEIIQMPNLRRRFLMASIAVGILLLAYILSAVTFESKFTLTNDRALFAAAAFFAVVFLGIIWLSTRSRFNPFLVVGLLIVSLLLEVTMFDGATMRPVRYDPYTVPPFVSYLQHVPTTARIVGLNSILATDIATAYGLDDIRFNDALNPQRFFDFSRSLLITDKNDTNGQLGTLYRLSRFDGLYSIPRFNHALDLLNVEYLLTTDPQPPQFEYSPNSPFELVHQSAGVSVYRNPNALPRAFVVHAAEVIPTFESTITRLGSADFDPSRIVILQQSPASNFMLSLPTESPDNVLPVDNVQILARSNNDLTIQANLHQPGFLVVSELDYPGWEAVVDGQPTNILTADGVIRAVPLNAGDHVVHFRYRPRSLLIGVIISVLALIVLLTLSAGRAWRQQVAKVL